MVIGLERDIERHLVLRTRDRALGGDAVDRRPDQLHGLGGRHRHVGVEGQRSALLSTSPSGTMFAARSGPMPSLA